MKFEKRFCPKKSLSFNYTKYYLVDGWWLMPLQLAEIVCNWKRLQPALYPGQILFHISNGVAKILAPLGNCCDWKWCHCSKQISIQQPVTQNLCTLFPPKSIPSVKKSWDLMKKKFAWSVSTPGGELRNQSVDCFVNSQAQKEFPLLPQQLHQFTFTTRRIEHLIHYLLKAKLSDIFPSLYHNELPWLVLSVSNGWLCKVAFSPTF